MPVFGIPSSLAEDAYGPDQPPGELMAFEDVFEVMAFVVGELGDRGLGIAFYQFRIMEEVPAGFLAYVVLPGGS